MGGGGGWSEMLHANASQKNKLQESSSSEELDFKISCVHGPDSKPAPFNSLNIVENTAPVSKIRLLNIVCQVLFFLGQKKTLARREPLIHVK